MSSEAGSSGFHSCNATKSQTTGRSLKVPGLCFLISRGPVSYRDHILLWWNNHSYSPSIGFFSSCPILGLLILLQSHSRRQQDCHNFDDFFSLLLLFYDDREPFPSLLTELASFAIVQNLGPVQAFLGLLKGAISYCGLPH